MFYVAICDDDRFFLDETKRLLEIIFKELNEDYEIDCFNSTQKLEPCIRKYNLLILAIMLVGNNGIEYAESLRSRGIKTDIIFITSSPDYALEGYSVHPIDYILKPANYDRLHDAVMRCLRERHNTPALLINSKEHGKIRVNTDDIAYCEVMRYEIVIHSIDGKRVSLYGTFSSFCSNELPQESFYRCHRSYAVNLQYVESINRYAFALSNGVSVPIAKNNYNDAKKRFADYINSFDDAQAQKI